MWENINSKKESFTWSISNNDIKVISPEIKNGEPAQNIKKEAQKNKDDLFESLMWASLKENTEHAKILTKEALAKIKWNDTLFNKLKTYQTEHLLLPADGRVWPETYSEMKADKIVEKAWKGFEKDWLSLNTLKEINLILPKLGKTSKNKGILTLYLSRFKSEEKFKTKREKLDFKKELNNSEFTTKKEQTKLEKSKEWQSIYALMKSDKPVNEKIETLMKNPTLLMVWWLLFLFGVIWWDTKYTDSFFKRIGWIMWGTLLWPKLWKELWWSEIIDDMVWDDETQTSSTTSSETKLNTQEQANFNKIKENSPHSEMNQDTYSAVLSLKNDTSPNNWFKNNEQLINWTFEYIAKNTEFLSKNIDWALDNKWELKAEYFTAAWFVEWKDFILVAWLKLTRIDFERFVKKLIQRRDISSASEKTFWDLFKENKESETSFDFSIDWVSKWWEQTNWIELWVTSITVFKTLTSKTWFGAIFWWALSVANITDLSDLIKNENFQKFSKSLEKFGENISAWEFIKAFSESFWIEETKITEKINTVIDLPFYAYWKFKEWFNQASWTELVLTALPWFMVFKSSKIAWKLFWAAVTTMQITDVTSLIQNENIKKLSKNFEKAWKDIDEWEIVKAFKDIFNFTDEKIEEIKNSDIKIEKVNSKEEETSISSPETTSISKEIKDTESSIKTIESEIQKLKSELENKELDYKTATPSKKSELKNEISELKTQISRLNETLNWLKITLENQKKEEETLKNEKQKEEINKNAEKYIKDYDKIDLYFTKTIPEFNLDKITSNEWNLATANEIKKFITELDYLEKTIEAWDNKKIQKLKQNINELQNNIRNYKENLKKEINSYYETNNQYIEKVDSINFSASDFEIKNKDLIDYFNADKSLEKNISYIKNIFWTKFYNETNFNTVKEKYKEIIETKLKKAWINLKKKEGLLIIANALKLNISINENSFYQNLDKAKENEQKIKAEKKYISEFNEYLSNTDIINSKEPNILLEKYNKYLSITSSIDLESDTEISKTISSIDEKITKMKSYLISNKSNILKKLETSKDINDYNKVKKLYKEFVWLDIEQDLLKIPYYKESQRPKELGLVEQAKSIKEIQAIINTRPNLKNKIIEIVKQRNIEDIKEILILVRSYFPHINLSNVTINQLLVWKNTDQDLKNKVYELLKFENKKSSSNLSRENVTQEKNSDILVNNSYSNKINYKWNKFKISWFDSEWFINNSEKSNIYIKWKELIIHITDTEEEIKIWLDELEKIKKYKQISNNGTWYVQITKIN